MISDISKTIVALAVKEDLGGGDITSQACIPDDLQGSARIIARKPLVFCGHEVAALVCSTVDPSLQYHSMASEGFILKEQEVIAVVRGSVRSILAAERTCLNFMQRLSGIASTTRSLVELVADLPVRLLDTRKTTPGLRELEKYAVKVGGGANHRFGLSDAVLIKNNHVDANQGNVAATVMLCRSAAVPGIKIEVEVRNLGELTQALGSKPDAILLDNMDVESLQRAVKQVRGFPGGENIELEASGNISVENLREVALTGVNSISMGMLTHSVRAADIALRLEPLSS